MQGFQSVSTRLIAIAAIFCLALLSAGCATPSVASAEPPDSAAPENPRGSHVDPSFSHADPSPRSRVEAPVVSPTDPPTYRIQRGDRLRVAFPYDPVLDQEVAVRPDGRISLPGAGEVVAHGSTPEELAGRLAEALGNLLQHPEPTVIVLEVQPSPVFVGGAVRAPGAFDLSPRLTAMRAIVAAGGALEPESLRSVVVVRRRAGEAPVHLRVDLLAHLAHGGAADPTLEAGDLVFVPAAAEATP